MDGAQDVGQESDDALKEEVEEEDGSGAAEEAVEDEDDLSRHRPGRGHTEPCQHINTGMGELTNK